MADYRHSMNVRKYFGCLLLAMHGLMVPPGLAQNQHGIIAIVNDDIVTTHDLSQRVMFMLATTGAERNEATVNRLQRQALRNLIDEHIQIQESRKFELSISDEEINRSVAQLFGRNGLDPNQVINGLASMGISIETLRNQVRAEIAWQRIINGLYGSRIRISDTQIDETLSRITSNASKPSYRVAEIYLEATPDIGGQKGAMEGAQAMIEQLNQDIPFALLAQQFSSSPTAAKGGDMGWVRAGELRPELNTVLTTLQSGQISQPIEVPEGVYIITLINKEIPESETIYKLKQINFEAQSPDSKAQARADLIRLQDTLTNCETLQADAQSVENLNSADMGEIRESDLSSKILEKLDKTTVNRLSEPIETPVGLVSIMVCDKYISGSNIPTRDQIENRLIEQQVSQASRRHLRDLRRKAAIDLR